MPINPNEPIQKYKQVAADLTRRIRSGELTSSGFPSISDIVEEYGVSRGTAQHAQKEVKKAGYLTDAVEGVGYYVLPREKWPG